MSVSTVHVLDKIEIGGWASDIDVVTSFRQSPQVQSRIVNPSGHTQPMYTGGERQTPRITFTTPQIDVVLAACGLTGYATATDSYVYYKKATETGSTARASLAHKRFAVSQVFVFWDNLQLPDSGQATVDVTIVPVWDGSNEPIVPAGSLALSGNLAAGNEFQCGPGSINNTSLPGVQSESVRLNMSLRELTAGGEGWATFAGCESVQPIVNISTVEAVGLTTYGLDGTALDGTNGVEFYARRLDTANGTTSHIYFQATDGKVITDDSGPESTTGHVTDNLRVECIAPDDSTDCLTWTVGSAIT